jgi:hypothetical protein
MNLQSFSNFLDFEFNREYFSNRTLTYPQRLTGGAKAQSAATQALTKSKLTGSGPRRRWSPEPAIQRLPGWSACTAWTRIARGTKWWWRCDQMVTGVTTVMMFCGGARRRSTRLRYRPPHDERKGSKGAQAHHDACRMVDEVGDDRSWAIDQEIRRSLLQGNGEMCSITSPPCMIACTRMTKVSRRSSRNKRRSLGWSQSTARRFGWS